MLLHATGHLFGSTGKSNLGKAQMSRLNRLLSPLICGAILVA